MGGARTKETGSEDEMREGMGWARRKAGRRDGPDEGTGWATRSAGRQTRGRLGVETGWRRGADFNRLIHK